MNRNEALERLKFLYDQVHQTAERLDHLEERVPLHVQTPSLNYHKDLSRIKGDYNRFVRQAEAEGLLTRADIEAAELPLEWDG